MKKRQNIRSGIIIMTFLLFPIIQFYFSPYLIVWGATKGIITASFFTFSILLFGSMFVGRAFCGWFMACGGMQEILFSVNNKKPRTGKLDYLKYALWTQWLLSIVLVVLLAGGYRKIDYFFHLDYGISVNNVFMYIPYYSVILIFFILPVVFGKRAVCHYLCWMSPFMIVGRKISNLLAFPALRIQVDESKCINCHICNKECPMSLDVCLMVNKRKMENSECILCGKCIDSCPKQVLWYYWGKPVK
jgi:ferredoxin-type protein NapH